MFLRVRPVAAFVFALTAIVPTVASAQIEEGRIPLQTAMTELFRFRESYAENYNRKDFAAITAMFDTSAVMVQSNGTVLKGRAAIGTSFTQGTQPHMVIESDSVRVFGNTAIDHGTLKLHPNGAPEMVSRYLVVLRRGYTEWKINYVAQTPVTK